jgi:hypothetical protein
MVSDHATCPIATYREWLEDVRNRNLTEKQKKRETTEGVELVTVLQSEFDMPNCGICRGELKGLEKKKKKKKKKNGQL